MYDQDFIAANQSERADNIVKGSKKEQMETIRQQIRDFKQSSQVDKVIVLWTANTERYSSVAEGLNDTAENFLASIDNNEAEVCLETQSSQTSCEICLDAVAWRLAASRSIGDLRTFSSQLEHVNMEQQCKAIKDLRSEREQALGSVAKVRQTASSNGCGCLALGTLWKPSC